MYVQPLAFLELACGSHFVEYERLHVLTHVIGGYVSPGKRTDQPHSKMVSHVHMHNKCLIHDQRTDQDITSYRLVCVYVYVYL